MIIKEVRSRPLLRALLSCTFCCAGESADRARDHLDGAGTCAKDVQLRGMARQKNRIQEVRGSEKDTLPTKNAAYRLEVGLWPPRNNTK